MAAFLTTALILGGLVGARFKVSALVLALLCSLAVVIAVAVAAGTEPAAVVTRCLLLAVALQLGFLAGGLMADRGTPFRTI